MVQPSPTSTTGGRGRRWLGIFLVLLTLFLLGTVVVLSTAVAYFGVDQADLITAEEMSCHEQLASMAAQLAAARQEAVSPLGIVDNNYSGSAMYEALITRAGVADDGRELEANPSVVEEDQPRQRVPKIVHQTWMSETLPSIYQESRVACQVLHPDYEYILWTDVTSRKFIATNYPWFLSTFDNYPYPIQRADAIRYFVLHSFGGIYMDLDVGCQRNMDPLLYYPVVLPATIPVGVSNDIMFSEKGHPFMDLVIHNLVTFNHQYGTNYPTVMFSTGPMFLSAQVGFWHKQNPISLVEVRQVRVLPRRWYGKNAPAEERESAYFSHLYGSSWHADDAGFIVFLGKSGITLVYLGFAVVLFGAGRLLWSKRVLLRSTPRTPGPIALPFHVPDLYGRPSSPSSTSRSSSPSRSRSSTPHGGQRRRNSDAAGNQGALFYIPVWLLPPGAPSSPNGTGEWTQAPGFAADAPERECRPIRGYTRLEYSPHASSVSFAGADDIALRSYPSPRLSPSSPSSPKPPAYTALKLDPSGDLAESEVDRLLRELEPVVEPDIKARED